MTSPTLIPATPMIGRPPQATRSNWWSTSKVGRRIKSPGIARIVSIGKTDESAHLLNPVKDERPSLGNFLSYAKLRNEMADFRSQISAYKCLFR